MQRSLIAGVALACLPWLALGQASSCSTIADSPNLLQNPSYEDSDPNSDWNVYGMRSWELTLGTTGSLDGAQHLVIPGVTEKTINPGDASMVIGPQYYQNVRVEPGHNYYMSFSFRPQVLDRSMEGEKSCLVLLGLDAHVLESEALARTTLSFNAQQADLPWQSLSAIFQVPRGGNTQNSFRMLIACNEPDDKYEMWVDNTVFRRLGAAEPCNTLPAETTFAPTTNGGQWQTFSPPRPTSEISSAATSSTESTPTSSNAVPSPTPSPPFTTETETAAQTTMAQVTVTAPAITVTTYSTVTVTVTAAAATVTAYSSVTTTSTVTTTVATETVTQTQQAGSKMLRKRRGCKPRSASSTATDTYTTATTTATSVGASATVPSSISPSTLASSEPTATTTVFITPTSTVAGGTVTVTEMATPTLTTTLQTTVTTATVTSSATLTQTTTVVQPPPPVEST
ncbi:solute carrier family 6 member 5/9 [Microdochium nivale]|nr:solute carrier family 6 member 5/9 [Microdochium nivale]